MNRQSDADLFSQPGQWLMDTARRNPEGFLLLAAGCALLMRSGRGRAMDRLREPSAPSSQSRSGLNEGLSRASETVTEYTSGVKDRVANTANEYADAVSDFAGDARRWVSEGSAELTRQAKAGMEGTVDRVLRDQPLAIALAGLAAGAVVAAAFPASEIENRTLGGAREALTGAAAEAGSKMMEAAGKAGERLKEAAEERGLTSEGLKAVAGEVADSFKDSIAGKSDDHSSATTVPKDEGSGVRPSGTNGDEHRNPKMAGTPTGAGGRSNR